MDTSLVICGVVPNNKAGLYAVTGISRQSGDDRPFGKGTSKKGGWGLFMWMDTECNLAGIYHASR